MAVTEDRNKSYSLEIEEHDGYLHAIVGGLRVTPRIALDYWQEIIQECEKKKCSKILLEHNFLEMIPMLEMLEIIGPVGELLKGRTLAFIDRFGHDDVPEAGKMILRSHDVKMRIFHDMGEAERWLSAN
jgi:hypothetical protein